MINEIKYPLKPLTVVTGMNGAGKSTALHDLRRRVPPGEGRYGAVPRVEQDRTPVGMAQLVHSVVDQEVFPLLRIPHRPDISSKIPIQLDAWLRYIIPGDPTNNPGSGVSNAWVVVIAALAAPHGSILFIEVPEQALHPRAQTRIGEFLCAVAASGVFVVVETHSEHVFNAVRLAVKHKVLTPSDVDTYYFSVSGDADPSFSVELLSIDHNGKLPMWPKGFFDETEDALDQLLAP